MPTPVSNAFDRARDHGRVALIAYVTGGSPTVEDTVATLPAIAEAGADLIEVGLPFSDPIADGPVIAEAMHHALLNGATPQSVLDSVRGFAATGAAPVLAMVSYSIVHRIGAARFVSSLVHAGVRGLIVPDLDVDAEAELSPSVGARCADAGIDLVLLAAPTTSPRRLERIATASRGFIYVVARTGITGDRGDADLDELSARLATLRGFTDTPLAVGFGISTPEQVARIATLNGDGGGALVDGVIVGTALVRRMADAGPGSAAAAASEFVRGLASATEARLGHRAG